MTEALIEGGALFAKLEDRTLSGILLPWNEQSRPNSTGQGPITFSRGTVSLPRDVSIVSANLQHDRSAPVARATKLDDTDKGIVATFAVAETPEGDDLLLQVSEGKLRKLSAEVKKLVVDGSKAVSAVLFGAAFVTEGAFESAALFAIGDPVEDEGPPQTLAPVDGVLTIDATSQPETVIVTAEGTSTTFNPAAPNTESEFSAMPTATVPPGTPAAPAAATRTHITDVAAALALFSRNGDRSLIDGISEKPDDLGLFALSDVKLTTTGSVGVNIQQPQWLGELWSGRGYERRVIPLISSGNLTSFKVKGFRWTTKPAMAAWAGDKANVPSNAPATEGYEVTAARYAGGHDIAREYRDFDVPEFWEAYFKAMTDSYSKLTDDAALTTLVAGATAVTAGAVPSGVNSGLVSIVDGALAVLPEGVPSFAIVASDVYRSLALMKDIDKLAFLNTSLGLEEGTLTSFKVVPHPSIATGKALVGVKAGATSFELPGSPIRTEALDQIKGGIDEALFGYAAVTIDNPAALALVTPAA